MYVPRRRQIGVCFVMICKYFGGSSVQILLRVLLCICSLSATICRWLQATGLRGRKSLFTGIVNRPVHCMSFGTLALPCLPAGYIDMHTQARKKRMIGPRQTRPDATAGRPLWWLTRAGDDVT